MVNGTKLKPPSTASQSASTPGTGEWTAPSAEGNNRLPHQREANVVRRLAQSGSSKIENLPQRLE